MTIGSRRQFADVNNPGDVIDQQNVVIVILGVIFVVAVVIVAFLSILNVINSIIIRKPCVGRMFNYGVR